MFILSIIILSMILLYLKFKNYVPILMYHRIADIPGDRNALPKERFEQQLQYLSLHNYHTITPDDLYNYYVNNIKLPPNPILLTFDDGYTDNYTDALPLLQKYNMKAVVFPIYNWIGKTNEWENFGKKSTTTMTIDELKSWQNQGMDIQPHTANHPFLTQCNHQQLKLELSTAKQQFETLLQKTMDYLCYPYGFFNQQVIDVTKQSQYKMAFAIFDHVPLWHINLFALPRIPIPSHQKMWEFKLKVSSIHIIFIALRKWERNFKHLKNKLKNKNS